MPRVAFLWHLHQPDYRHPVTGVPTMPWTRLHALRGYRDMVLETFATLRDEGRAIVLVTHDTTVSDAADRVLRITDGVVSETALASASAA